METNKTKNCHKEEVISLLETTKKEQANLNPLGEFTVLALDQNHSNDQEIYMLRVESEEREDTLGHTI